VTTRQARSGGVSPPLSHLNSAWPACLLAACAASIVAISLAFIPVVPVRRAESPDGAFEAVARTAPVHLLIPVMPGQSGDHAGRITIYTKGGRSCGSAPVEMVWMIQDLRWDLARKPREASLVALATWDLDACSVDVYGR
jgi:hypothetical protein